MRFLSVLFTMQFLLLTSSKLLAVDMLYVSMNDYTIVSFDTDSNDGDVISSTMATFANTNLNNPTGLAVDSIGNVYASNSLGNTISKFDRNGIFLSTIGGSEDLKSINSLAIDKQDNLYVMNSGEQGAISKFDSGGVYLGNIISNLYWPLGLAIDNTNNFYVSFPGSNFIFKFNSAGSYLDSIGGYTNFPQPNILAIDSLSNLYASSQARQNVSKYNPALQSIGSINGLLLPFAIAIDSSDNLYVSEVNSISGTGNISKFDSAGKLIVSWSTGSQLPCGFAVHTVTVPEPSTYILSGIAILVLIVYQSSRQKTS